MLSSLYAQHFKRLTVTALKYLQYLYGLRSTACSHVCAPMSVRINWYLSANKAERRRLSSRRTALKRTKLERKAIKRTNLSAWHLTILTISMVCAHNFCSNVCAPMSVRMNWYLYHWCYNYLLLWKEAHCWPSVHLSFEVFPWLMKAHLCNMFRSLLCPFLEVEFGEINPQNTPRNCLSCQKFGTNRALSPRWIRIRFCSLFLPENPTFHF